MPVVLNTTIAAITNSITATQHSLLNTGSVLNVTTTSAAAAAASTALHSSPISPLIDTTTTATTATTPFNWANYTAPIYPTFPTFATYATEAIIITPVDDYYWYSYYYYYLLLLFLVLLSLICLKVAINRRKALARQEALLRARQRAQAQGTTTTVTGASSDGGNTQTPPIPKNLDQPPAYDDVVQSYINTKQQLQTAEVGAASPGTFPTTPSTVTMETELGSSITNLPNDPNPNGNSTIITVTSGNTTNTSIHIN